VIITAIIYSWAIRYSSTVRGSGMRYSLINILSEPVLYHPCIFAKCISPSRIPDAEVAFDVFVTSREIFLDGNRKWWLHFMLAGEIFYNNRKKNIFLLSRFKYKNIKLYICYINNSVISCCFLNEQHLDKILIIVTVFGKKTGKTKIQ